MAGGKLACTLLGFCAGSAVTYYMVQLQSEKRKRDIRQHEEYFGPKALAVIASDNPQDLISSLMEHLWTTCWNPAGVAMMKEMMIPILKEQFPSGPLSNLQILELDLGNTPMRLDNIVVHEVTTANDDGGAPSCQFDMDILWDGRCNLQFRAPKLGSNFGIRSMKLYGRMSMILKPLTQELPCIAGISYAFINSPHLSLDFTGLASVAEFSVIDETVKQTLQDTLDSMVVLPQRMTYKMDDNCSILQMYTPPKGIVRIIVSSSRGFQIEKRTLAKADVPDVYCKVRVGNSRTVQTSTVPNNLAPSWATEPMDFILHDYDEFLQIHTWDEDKGALDSDDDLGKIAGNIRIRDLLLAPDRTMELELFDSTNSTKSMDAFVTVQCAILPLSPIEAVSNMSTSINSTLITKHVMPGMMNILISQAFNIPKPARDAGTFVNIKLSTGESLDTGIVQTLPDGSVNATDPFYDAVLEVPLSPLSAAAQPDVTLTVFQVGPADAKKPQNINLGSTTVTWKDLQSHPVIQEKRSLKADISLEFNVTLRGTNAAASHEAMPVGETLAAAAAVVAADAAAHASTAAPTVSIKPTKTSIPSIGSGIMPNKIAQASTSSLSVSAPSSASTRKVRVVAVKGRGFVVRRKGALRKKDIPDVFLKINVGQTGGWTTPVIKNSITPVWDAAKMFDLSDANNATLTVEGYDKNSGKFDDDDFYGVATTTIGKILLSGGTAELELLGGKSRQKPTGLFITMTCSLSN